MNSASLSTEKNAAAPDPVAAMRPVALAGLMRSIASFPGVGPKTLKHLERLLRGMRVWDLLTHLPIDRIDRAYRPKIADAALARIATITVRIIHHKISKKSGIPTRLVAEDSSGAIDLVFFRTYPDMLEKQYPIGADIVISGTVEQFQGKKQIVHPDWLGYAAGIDWAALKSEPVYPLTEGVSNKLINRLMAPALETLPALPEWIGADLLKRENWPSWPDAIRHAHNPGHDDDLNPLASARRRLAFDELLSHQLALALMRDTLKGTSGRALATPPALREKFLAALPFQLTNAQKRVIGEIDADMAKPERMMRLLQGDVGSGKTIVAALAMMNAVASGTQAALMAPTEILARQHAQTLEPIFAGHGITCVTLTGRDKGKARNDILDAIASGRAHIVIGTHALFQDSIQFHDLGLAVIDEQHRFGVHQRLMLTGKGTVSDMLVMTATPIPRTLTMTAYGDLDVSRLDEKPPGRKPIDTRLISTDKMDELIAGLKRRIAAGAQVYWVCPLIEESEKIDLAATEERAALLKSLMPEQRIGLLHGRMKPAEKDAVMTAFANRDIDLLVATTVIEVGVNVPNATIMVIDHAQRYGMAQIHQLRGRVGRGDVQSYCFLLYAPPLSQMGRQRLTTLKDSEDGFALAELDLKLRGPGDVLGAQQSGLPDFRFAGLADHADLLSIARDNARYAIARDPGLASPQSAPLRLLLHLFDRDKAMNYRLSG